MAEEQSKNEDQNNAQDASESETKTEESAASHDDDPKETKQSNDKSSTKPKTPVKETKGKKSKKQEKEESEDESDDEELVGLLDAPLVVEGKRVRKSTEFLSNTITTPQSLERKKIEIPQGKGELLGNMPRVQFQLSRIPADELKPLHKLLFGKLGANSEVKKNIRHFNGFDIEKGSQEYKKKEEQVDRFTTDSLRRLCEILDVEKKGKKEEMLNNVMDFLLLPKASGKPVKQPSKKGSASKKSGTKRKRPEKEKEGKSKKKKSDETVESDEDSEAEEDKEAPVKKAKSTAKSTAKSPKKEKKESKKESKKPVKKEKKVVSIKISPGKKAKKAKEKKEHSDDSSDDEPLSKRAKKSPPTNEEIVELVKELLDGADLEKITMKSICKQVYERFPDFDLTDRKEFIKDSVKEIIT